jgi:hypothetical protein
MKGKKQKTLNADIPGQKAPLSADRQGGQERTQRKKIRRGETERSNIGVYPVNPVKK